MISFLDPLNFPFLIDFLSHFCYPRHISCLLSFSKEGGLIFCCSRIWEKLGTLNPRFLPKKSNSFRLNKKYFTYDSELEINEFGEAFDRSDFSIGKKQFLQVVAKHIIQGRFHLEANILKLGAHLFVLHHHDITFLLGEVPQGTCVYFLHDLCS